MPSVTWKCPSNIALVKYWGKKGNQLPANPSLSFTLEHCHTVTNLRFEKRPNDGVLEVSFSYEGRPMPDFEPKLETFFNRVEEYFPFLTDYQLEINTTNTFPHSSGIASSASGMGALALCLCSMERMVGENLADARFYKKASEVARLGSGSACRSVYGPAAVWGQSDFFEGSSDEYAIPYELNTVFRHFCDTILIVDEGKKEVSSTLGHAQLKDHPMAAARFARAGENMGKLKEAFTQGDLQLFTRIVEEEALMLHALMMTGDPPFILMKPNTLAIIQKVWEFRKQSRLNLVFTLDAGANVHLLYPVSEKKEVLKFIEHELLSLCQNRSCIHDQVGAGPEQLA